jgi:hypothetical protein
VRSIGEVAQSKEHLCGYDEGSHNPRVGRSSPSHADANGAAMRDKTTFMVSVRD